VTDGWVVSFTEDVAEALGERSNAALTRLKTLAETPVVSLTNDAASKRIAALCAELYESISSHAKATALRCAGCSR
jgi:AraC family transcriptional activator of pobA